MEIKELFGMTITKVYAVFEMEQGWLDTADCFLELDRNKVIGFPFSHDREVWIREIPNTAEQLFQNNGSGIVVGKRIRDFVWYEDDDYGGYFLSDDGSLITEIRMSPHDTGQAGLNYCESLQELAGDKGIEMKKLSGQNLNRR